jgi:hypothetical protein
MPSHRTGLLQDFIGISIETCDSFPTVLRGSVATETPDYGFVVLLERSDENQGFCAGICLLVVVYIWTSANCLAAGQPEDIETETVGARNINAGQMKLYSIERVISQGRERADELECRRRTVDEPVSETGGDSPLHRTQK